MLGGAEVTGVEWLTLWREFGYPALITAVGGYAAWKVCAWLAVHVIKPVVDRHIKFIDELRDGVKVIAEAMNEIKDSHHQLKEDVATLRSEWQGRMS